MFLDILASFFYFFGLVDINVCSFPCLFLAGLYEAEVTDSRLRRLERKWKETGLAQDEATYLLERVSVGDLPREMLELAAHCGYGPAILATGREPLEVDSINGVRDLLSSFTDWEPRSVLRFTLLVQCGEGDFPFMVSHPEIHAIEAFCFLRIASCCFSPEVAETLFTQKDLLRSLNDKEEIHRRFDQLRQQYRAIRARSITGFAGETLDRQRDWEDQLFEVALPDDRQEQAWRCEGLLASFISLVYWEEMDENGVFSNHIRRTCGQIISFTLGGPDPLIEVIRKLEQVLSR